jgi:hypothetical protein
MRVFLILLASLLVVPVAHAKKGPSIPASGLGELDGGWRGTQWDCATTRLDGRDNKEVGFLACLTDYAIDPRTGATVMAFEVVDEPRKDRGIDDYAFRLVLDQGPLDRTLTDFEVVELSGEQGQMELKHRPENDVRHRLRVAFTFFTWAPELAIKKVKLKHRGAPPLKWSVDGDLAWKKGSIEEPPHIALRLPDDPGHCQWTDLGGGGARRAAKYLEDNVQGQQFQVVALIKGTDDAVVRFVLPDPKFEIAYDEGRLVVVGAEKVVYKLPHFDEDPKGKGNELAFEFDGEDLVAHVNGESYGPFYVRRRQPKREQLRWDIEVEGGRTKIAALEVAPCFQEDKPDPVATVEPEPESKSTERTSDDARPVRRKKGPSALEVLAGVQKGMMIGQGVATAAQSGMDAAGTMGDNVTAMNEGRYEDVESMDYQVNVGNDGHVTSSYSKSKMTQNEDGSIGVHSEGTYVDTRSGTVARGTSDTRVDASQGGVSMSNETRVTDNGRSASKVSVLCSVDPRFTGKIALNGNVIEALVPGTREAQLAFSPGTHKVEILDAAGAVIVSGVLELSATSTLRIGAGGEVSSAAFRAR